MTNIDPGGILVLLTVILAVPAGIVSIALAHLVAWLGYGDYEGNVWAILAAMAVVLVVGSLVFVETSMLYILSVVLAMVGAYAVTRDRTATSYGWVLGVLFLYLGFALLSATGLYAGVDRTGTPQGVISRNLFVFYYGGLFVCGALGGAMVAVVRRW